MKTAQLDHLLDSRNAKRSIARLTDIATGAEALVVDGKVEGALAMDTDLEAALRDALAREQSRLYEREGRRVFIHVLAPPLRLAIVGAGHISQYLSSIAAEAGFDVTVIDPRTTYASAERFPRAKLSHDWPDEALEAFGLDRRSAVVTLSHDPKLDEPALASALRSDAFYIGALGSRKTQAQRRERMKAQGFGESELDRIHGPVGLDIGALSPAEIAIAIIAQIIDVLRPKKKGVGVRAA
ncbi:MAG: XdhC family protein [Alphaproteobacteria bacterium]